MLHLLLGCGAITGDAGFHFARRITVRGNGSLRRRKQDDAADFGELQSGSHIQRGENGFDGDGIGREFRHEVRDQLMDLAQADGERCSRGKFQGAEAKQARRGALEFDDAVAGGAGEGRIDAEHAESRGFCGWRQSEFDRDKCSARGLWSVVFFGVGRRGGN